MLSIRDFKARQVVFALLSHGEKLSFKNDNVIIKDETGKMILQSSCYRVFSLLVIGHVSITSGLLQRAKKFGFSIVLMSHSLKPYAMFNAATEGNVLLRSKQYHYQSFDLARHIVKNKVANQQQVLKNIREKEDEVKEAITKIDGYLLQLENLSDKSLTLESIMGLEGMSAKVYFNAFFKNLNWKGRKPRTKIDSINTLLDIGYTQLFNLIEALLNLYGFDIYKGVLHQTFYQRKSLVCDLVEPFRPIIDREIKKAFNLGQVKEDDFIRDQGKYLLLGKSAKPYVTFLLKVLMAHKVELFHFVQQYYRSFIREAPIEKYPIFNLKK